MITRSLATRLCRWLCALAPAVAMMTAAPVYAQTSKGDTKPAAKADAKAETKGDRITLRDGTVVTGSILDENETSITVNATIAGIRTKTTFDKGNVLTIERGVVALETKADPKADAAAGIKTDGKTDSTSDAKDDTAKDPNATSVYHIKLTGTFGSQISQTPLSQALKDARKQKAELIVIELKADWSPDRDERRTQEGDEQVRVDEAFRALTIVPAFTEDLEREWPDHPKVVFWVRQAMGPAALMPLASKNLYMSSDARIGGLGNIEKLFKQGDKVVIEKQISLRLGRAEGLAIQGGHDPRIAKGMMLGDMILSYRLVGGKAELLDRYPENDGEVLLKDDGKEDRKDTIEQIARGETNDLLLLDADTAFKLGVSKGTADTFEDLMVQLDIGRRAKAVTRQPDGIMQGWKDRLQSATREMPKLWREYNEAQAPDGPNQAQQVLAIRISKLNALLELVKRWEEAIPYPQVLGVPDRAWIELRLQQLKLEQINLGRPNSGGGGASGGSGRGGRGGGGG